MSKIRFTKLNPLPAYTGPRPVYRADFPWAGARPCYVRRNGKVWETAACSGNVAGVHFSACPVSSASSTRHQAVMAWDYFFNQGA
jgi:hypothetical protein